MTFETRFSSSCLAVIKAIDPHGKVAIAVGLEPPDLRDQCITAVLHLFDKVGDAAVLGFERTEPRLQFAKPGLQPPELEHVAVDRIEAFLRLPDEFGNLFAPGIGIGRGLVGDPEHIERTIEIAEKPFDLLAQRSQPGKLLFKGHHSVFKLSLVVGKRLHAHAKAALRRLQESIDLGAQAIAQSVISLRAA